jgi:hypothetical protein
MRHAHGRRLGAILAVGGVTAVVCATAANAGQASHESIHDEGTVVLEDFCDVPGLDVDLDFTLDLRIQGVQRGPDRFAYFLSHGKRTETITNPATGRSVATRSGVIEKDLRITDNGDGTLTVLVLATGNATVYGADGKAIARNPGQVRFELLVDTGGTPSDPSDDEVIERLETVKESTGRSDDFCAAVVPALT